ncbi:hypothetical protein KIL84_008644 [Mauremys mutica]|uniref:Uncharacterized protein n=1 Tax=Mauremys mutica TaxID=74926 RepID=A0A9D3X866_9SAUR|nr:hypothetical protein KIL84_008644 [Mauremys mutica]
MIVNYVLLFFALYYAIQICGYLIKIRMTLKGKYLSYILCASNFTATYFVYKVALNVKPGEKSQFLWIKDHFLLENKSQSARFLMLRLQSEALKMLLLKR